MKDTSSWSEDFDMRYIVVLPTGETWLFLRVANSDALLYDDELRSRTPRSSSLHADLSLCMARALIIRDR